MKIGEFAAKNQISPDTVRYYVREGLLYPVREGYHFSFDEQCSRDLRRVQTLKNIGFSLSEIKQIMINSTERLFAAEASSSICRQLYEKRLAEITGELRRLEQARSFLEERLELEEAKADFSRPVGIPRPGRPQELFLLRPLYRSDQSASDAGHLPERAAHEIPGGQVSEASAHLPGRRERYRMDFTTPLQATNPFMNDRDQMYRLWLYLEKQR